MKQILIIILIVAVGISFSGCKKAFTNPNTYTLKGKVYVDCNKTPIANAIVIYVDNGIEGNGTGIHNGNLEVGRDTTNADGSFEINYKLPEGVGVLIDPNLTVKGVNTLYGVPDVKNIENLEVYAAPTCFLNVKLNVQKPYTNTDTLLVNNLVTGIGNLKIAGPFTTGTVYTIPNYHVLKHYYVDTDHPAVDSTKYIGSKLNNLNWQINRFVPLPCQSLDVVIDVK